MSPTLENKKNRRAFLKWTAWMGFTGFGIYSIGNLEKHEDIAWPLRRFMDFLDSFWLANFTNRTENLTVDDISTGPYRINGDEGMLDAIDTADWKLTISPPDATETAVEVTYSDILALPMVEEIIKLKCIEGWSRVARYKGVRFADFIKQYPLAAEAPYAQLRSVQGGYYVSMDMKSMMHPQTLLCTHINGEVISAKQGYPLRLITPVKYGIKNIKQIGEIAFYNSPPPDYWAENGYGSHQGL